MGPEPEEVDIDALKDAWTEADRGDMNTLIEHVEQILDDMGLEHIRYEED